MPEVIRKVAGVIVREGKLLLVRKRGTKLFLSPGGKPEHGETPVQTLSRELREETGLLLVDAVKMGRFEGISPFDDRAVLMDVYVANVVGSPRPGHEIEELLWVGGDFERHGIEVGSVFAHGVIPRLVGEGLVDARSRTPRFLATPEPGRPRIFVFDLDGTLVFHKQPLDKLIEESIHGLLARGDEVVFATARAPRGVARVLPDSLLLRPTLFCNGALCRADDMELFRRPLEPRIAAAIIDVLYRRGASFQLEYGARFYLHGDTQPFAHMLDYDYAPPPRGLAAQPRDGILKIVIAAGFEVFQSLGLLQDALQHIGVLVHDHDDHEYIELVDKHVNKFSSFDMLMRNDERTFLVYVVFMGAQQALQTFDLGASGLPALELITSAQPCIQCYGNVWWSGVNRLVIAASADDVERLTGFHEGPLPPDWVSRLTDRAPLPPVEVVEGCLRERACAVLRRYGEMGGFIYNAGSRGESCVRLQVSGLRHEEL